jgi:glucose/arabinose dehydrogenase
MTGTNHQTRTLLLPKSAPNLILISRGSWGNLDYQTTEVDSGVSQIKAFDITNITSPYNYADDGLVVGWGLRNSVGLAEHPLDYGIWSVENSADQLERSGESVSNDNPAEELNFHGYLNGTDSPYFGENFGYPTCFAAGDPSALPSFDGQVGDSFVIGTLNDTNNDDICEDVQTPILSFQAHSAPLDIKFNTAGTAAWITFHGSWNREQPTGYSLVVVEFANGNPVEPSTSTTAARSVLFMEDASPCNGGDGTCLRPVGLAWDAQGRLFMTSDGTGELWVVTRTDGSPTSGAGSNATGTIPEERGTETSSGSGSGVTGSASLMSWGALPLAVGFCMLAFVL